MSPLVIVAIVVVVVLVIAALAFNPLLAKRGDAAIAQAREELGGRESVLLLEPKAVGFGSEPEEAGGLRGQGVLALGADAMVFVTWAPRKVFRLPRAAVTSVTTSAADPRTLEKATVLVGFDAPGHDGSSVSWRVPEIARWLDALGYDWGPEGPPDLDEDDA
ncbi:MAG: hypothetical protein MUE36_03200 [Acidimicrobiales bacterium]|jgi:hypothetical protein|nr:hypothetical protein [Acidimicrobiales bacterium]